MAERTRKMVQVGEKLAARAVERLRNSAIIDAQNDTVRAKSDAPHGQWLCADCGDGLANNMQANSHTRSHRVGWWVLDAEDPHMEVP
jgi:hypothetical protein